MIYILARVFPLPLGSFHLAAVNMQRSLGSFFLAKKKRNFAGERERERERESKRIAYSRKRREKKPRPTPSRAISHIQTVCPSIYEWGGGSFCTHYCIRPRKEPASYVPLAECILIEGREGAWPEPPLNSEESLLFYVRSKFDTFGFWHFIWNPQRKIAETERIVLLFPPPPRQEKSDSLQTKKR